MKPLNNKILEIICLATVGLTASHCSSGSSSPSTGSTSSTANPYSVSYSVDYGMDNNGSIQIEVDGSFAGSGDTISASCSASGSPAASVSYDSTGAIDFSIAASSLAASTDTCVFSVINGGTVVGTSSNLLLSNSQGELSINKASVSRADSAIAGAEDILLTGTFTGSADQVWYACDGAGSFALAQAASSGQVDSTSQVSGAIPTPQNFWTCEFVVIGNGVQTIPFYKLGIWNAQDISTDTANGEDTIVLQGSFAGVSNSGDSVFAECDSATNFSQIGTLITDNSGTIKFQMATPQNFNSCQFYVQAQGTQSPIY